MVGRIICCGREGKALLVDRTWRPDTAFYASLSPVIISHLLQLIIFRNSSVTTMVQPSFSAPKKDVSKQASLTSALDIFLDNQHQSYFEELYRSEAVCLCILR